MRHCRLSVAPTWQTNGHFVVAAAPPWSGRCHVVVVGRVRSQHVFAVARHGRLPSWACLYFISPFARVLGIEWVRTHTFVCARACVMDRWAMATEVRRFLPSSRVVYGLDIVSVSLNFFSVPRTPKWCLGRSSRGDEQAGHMVTPRPPRKSSHSSLPSLVMGSLPILSFALTYSACRIWGIRRPLLHIERHRLHHHQFGLWTLTCLPTNNGYRLFTLMCCYGMCHDHLVIHVLLFHSLIIV